LLSEAAEPFASIDTSDVGSLIERIGDARLVLLGEATHGSSEFYRMRARITRELIERHGFRVAIEADRPGRCLRAPGRECRALLPRPVLDGPRVLALVVLGSVLMVTGVSGRCLVYRLLGVSTMRRERRTGPGDHRAGSATSS
jgi:hypothetical protein